jgi:hypothetical protein
MDFKEILLQLPSVSGLKKEVTHYCPLTTLFSPLAPPSIIHQHPSNTREGANELKTMAIKPRRKVLSVVTTIYDTAAAHLQLMAGTITHRKPK